MHVKPNISDMGQSSIRTTAHVILKIQPENGTEKSIGMVTAISLNVGQGSKPIYGVDSPFPQEIAAGGSASQVNLQMSLVILKGTNLESLGVVPYRHGNKAINIGTDLLFLGNSKYFNLRLYDRITGDLFYGVENCRVNSFTITGQPRAILRAEVSISGMYLQTGEG